MLPWVYLFIAAAFEVAWAVGLKYTAGFTKLWPSVLVVVGMSISFFFLAQAVRSIPIGTGYAIWTGIGAVGTAAFGVLLFHDPVTWPRVACILLIVGGIVGLKLTTP